MPAAEIVAQMALIVVAAVLVDSLEGRETPERALGTLIFAGGVAATILMVVAAWMSGNRRARLVAAAVGVYTGAALLLRAVDVDGASWALGGGVAVVGVAGLLVLAVRGPSGSRRDRGVAAGVLAVVTVGAAAVTVLAVVAPGQAPPPLLVAVVRTVAWSGTALAGLLLVVVGTVVDRPLARRAGLAFATLGTAHVVGVLLGPPQLTGVLELGAVSMFLFAAVPFLVVSVRAVGRQEELSRSRLAEFEAVIASVEERDHELRNVVAGLSGAARVLTDRTLGSSVDGQRLLVAAGAELARLQQMLDGPRAARTGEVSVGPLLRDFALVHGATGLDVDVDVDGELRAAIDPDALAQVLTNLLVNCARHAPGSRVTLRARAQGGQVVVEVADDGPGLPQGVADTVLRRGVRGPDSTGDGLGLAITSELVGRHGGTLALLPRTRGCTALVQLPAAVRTAQPIGA